MRPAGRAAARAGLATLVCAGCALEDPQAGRDRAEEARLAREIRGLHALVAAAEKGDLVRPDQVVIGVDESVVERLLSAGLPQQREVAGRFLVRVESVAVRFRHSRSVVELRGRVSAKAMPETFAELRLAGALHGVQIHPGSGRLTGDVILDELEVVRAAASGAESHTLEALLEDVGRERAESFAELLPPFEIPIRLEQTVRLNSFTEGPVSLAGGSVPIRLSVARLMPLQERLWVVLDATTGPWTAAP